jgi:D-alanyl-D-alanine carboxypeptidase
MRRLLLWACLLSQLPSAPVRTALADEVDDYIKGEMKSRQIPGLVLAVLRKEQTVKRAAFGLANVELNVPAKFETVFEIGSLTKQLTAAGILLLAQEGKLRVTDKINQYLPSAPGSWNEVTVHHLLTHTSGIRSYTGLEGFELRRHLSQRQFIEEIGKYPLEFGPGESWKYCNTGYNLLGYIIENVSGKSYWDFMSERIFQPLKMDTTTNRFPTQILGNRAAGYEQTNHILINRDSDLTDVFAAGAVVSTVGDLVKWNDALAGEKPLISASKQAMWTAAKLESGEGTGYGYGWRIGDLDGHKMIWHGGATSGFSAALLRFPDDLLAVIILTNTDEQIAPTLAKKVAQYYLGSVKR